jgi:predicted anti-sigma-YlaC factor YlaD
MNCDAARDLIDPFLDGTLAPAGRRELEAHLASCAACRDAMDDAGALRPPTAALPRSIDPPHDLWPAITRRLPRHRARPRWRVAALAAAAALLLMAGSSAVTLWLVRDHGSPRTASGATPAIEAGYVTASADLMRALDAERSRLAPATVATLERNLAVIDAAIAESRAALAADPGTRDLEALLWASYRQKVALLQQASRLAERS